MYQDHDKKIIYERPKLTIKSHDTGSIITELIPVGDNKYQAIYKLDANTTNEIQSYDFQLYTNDNPTSFKETVNVESAPPWISYHLEDGRIIN